MRDISLPHRPCSQFGYIGSVNVTSFILSWDKPWNIFLHSFNQLSAERDQDSPLDTGRSQTQQEQHKVINNINNSCIQLRVASSRFLV